jgi:hypothetical protein
LSRLCVKIFNRTLREKNQSPPKILLETCEPINQTLLKKFWRDLHEHFLPDRTHFFQAPLM